jgi:hypothetical protein
MKKVLVLLQSLCVIMIFFAVTLSSPNKAHAAQGFCPPVCLDEVNQHVKSAIKALDKADIVTAQSELNIIKSLLDQLKPMTSLK